MKKSEPVTLATVKQQITDLKNRHNRELQNLYKHQADQYLDEALDRYLQYDDDLALPASQQTSRMDFDDPAAILGASGLCHSSIKCFIHFHLEIVQALAEGDSQRTQQRTEPDT